MVSLKSIATELPQYRYSKEDIAKVGAQWLRNAPHERELFERFVSSSQISQRHFSVPLERILTLGGQGERAEIFQHEGPELLARVVQRLLDQARVPASQIDHMVFTSCSASVIPSVDTALVPRLGFRQTINRVPLYQHGCAGGVIGLALASRLLKPSERAIVSAVELCSLVYQAGDLSGGNLVGSAIFGDGAAAVLLDGSGQGLEVVAAQSHLVPNSEYLMGYGIEDDGVHLRLDRALPQALSRHAPPFVRSFLQQHSLLPEDISWWLFHPGGVKVLAVLEEVLGIARTQSLWSWEVLERYGNMSSASILFVLEAFMSSGKSKAGDKVCMLGVGPGLTIEVVLLSQG
jgi:alkylresorcinol/alkylpyrone synthase